MFVIEKVALAFCLVVLLHTVNVVSFSSMRFKKATTSTSISSDVQLFHSIPKSMQPFYLKASESDNDNTITEAVAKKGSSTADNVSTFKSDIATTSNVTDIAEPPSLVVDKVVTTNTTGIAQTISNKSSSIPKKAVKSSKDAGSDWLNQENQLKYSTVFGATLFGLVFGNILELAVQDDSVGGWAPQLSALLFSGTSYRLVMLEEAKRTSTKLEELKGFSKTLFIKTFGNPLVNLQQSISSKIQSKIKETVNTIQSIPDNTKKAIIEKKDDIVEEVQIKIENTKDEIKAIPARVSAAAQQKVQEQILEVKATPQRLSDKLAKLYESFVYEVSLIPGKVSASVQSTANRKKLDLINAVNKKIECAQSKYNSFVSTLPIPLPKSNADFKFKTLSNSAPVLKAAAPVKVATPVKAAVAPIKVAQPVKAVEPPVKVTEPVKASMTPAKVIEPVKAVAAPEPIKAVVAPIRVAEPAKAAVAPIKVAEPVKVAVVPPKVAEPVKAAVAPVKIAEPVKAVVTPAKVVPPVKPTSSTSKSSNPFASFFSSGTSSSKSATTAVTPKVADKTVNVPPTAVAVKNSTQPVASTSIPVTAVAEKSTAPPAVTVAKQAVPNSASSPYAYLFANKKNTTASTTTTTNTAPTTKPPVISKPSVTSVPSVPAVKAVTATPVKSTSSSGLFSFGNNKPSSTTPPPQSSTATPPVPVKVSTPTVPVKQSTFNGLFSFGNNKAPADSTPSPTPTSAVSSSSSTTTTTSKSSNSNSKSSPLLTENVRKSLISAAKLSTKELDTIDSTLQSYMEGSLAAENVYCQLVQSCNGNKDVVFNIFPDVIGALPRGDRKSNLNRFYQQQAF